MLSALQYTAMNNFSRNVKLLKGDLSEKELADRVGTTQPTIHRIITSDDYQPKAELLTKFSRAFGLSHDRLIHGDLSQQDGSEGMMGMPTSKRDVVRIPPLEGFELPREGLLAAYMPFENSFEVSRAWFDFNIGIDPSRVAAFVMPNDTLVGEVEPGAICFVDTGINDILSPLDHGVYAFQYGDVYDVKVGQRVAVDCYLFTGTKSYLDKVQIKGQREIEALRIIGRVMGKWHFKRMV
jgi:transcriptional regulator with XRE-family HTH domain